MNIHALLRDLGRDLGLDGLAPDAAGCCALDFDGLHTELRYVDSAQVFNLCAFLGPLPVNVPVEFLRELSMANLDPAGLAGCHFAVSPEQDELLLCRTVDADVDSSAPLLAALRQMVSVARTWRERTIHERPAGSIFSSHADIASERQQS